MRQQPAHPTRRAIIALLPIDQLAYSERRRGLLSTRLLLIGGAHRHHNPDNPVDPDQGFGDILQPLPLSLRDRNYYVALNRTITLIYSSSRTIALIHSSNRANIHAGLPENVGNLSKPPDGINTDNPKSRILGLIMRQILPYQLTPHPRFGSGRYPRRVITHENLQLPLHIAELPLDIAKPLPSMVKFRSRPLPIGTTALVGKGHDRSCTEKPRRRDP
jgi:hypothetical protein